MSEEIKQNVTDMVQAMNMLDDTKRELVAKMAATYASGLADGMALADQKVEGTNE